MNQKDSETRPSSSLFPTTRWTLIRSVSAPSGDAAHLALQELLTAYQHPLEVYLLGTGLGKDQAMEMLQGFFVHVLDKAVIGAADPSRGRFRTYLLTCLRNYVANEYRSLQAAKRGGGVEVSSLDALRDGEGTRFEIEPATLADPESAYDQAWARQVVTRAIESVRAEYTARKQGRLFDVLLEKLEDTSGSEAYAELATQLGMSEGALRTGASRLRSRLRERIRDEILDTVGDEDVDDEVKHLMRALGGSLKHL